MACDRTLKLGTLSALLAFLMWGLTPIYWRQLHGIAAGEILAHRIVWSAAILMVLSLRVGHVPWISLTLAASFGFYGLVKKVGRLNSSVSLLVELVVGQASVSGGAFGSEEWLYTLLLAGAGLVTIAPLLLFGVAARRIPLSRVGILQYVAPTLMLLLGTLLLGESFTTAHAISFGLIWLALGLYTVSLLQGARADRRTP